MRKSFIFHQPHRQDAWARGWLLGIQKIPQNRGRDIEERDRPDRMMWITFAKLSISKSPVMAWMAFNYLAFHLSAPPL